MLKIKKVNKNGENKMVYSRRDRKISYLAKKDVKIAKKIAK